MQQEWPQNQALKYAEFNWIHGAQRVNRYNSKHIWDLGQAGDVT